MTTDPAYRSNLWKYGKNGNEVLKELVSYSTIFIGGVNEINEILLATPDVDLNSESDLLKKLDDVYNILEDYQFGHRIIKESLSFKKKSDLISSKLTWAQIQLRYLTVF